MTANLVGTIWRDSNWHAFTVTEVNIADGTAPDRQVTLAGTTTHCTPWVCPWPHENQPLDVVAALDDVRRGRIFGWTRQDLWEKDPHRSPQPQISDEQRRLGLQAWERIKTMPAPDPEVVGRERRALIDAGLVAPDHQP